MLTDKENAERMFFALEELVECRALYRLPTTPEKRELRDAIERAENELKRFRALLPPNAGDHARQ